MRLLGAWMDLLEVPALPVRIQDATAEGETEWTQIMENHTASVADLTTAHEKSFPLTEQLMALILVGQGEMSAHERERFDDKMEREKIETWTREKVMHMYHKLFANVVTTFENPHHAGVTHGGQPRSF